MGIISFYSFTGTLVCVCSRFFDVVISSAEIILIQCFSKLLTNWLNMLTFFRFTDVDQFVNIRDAGPYETDLAGITIWYFLFFVVAVFFFQYAHEPWIPLFPLKIHFISYVSIFNPYIQNQLVIKALVVT